MPHVFPPQFRLFARLSKRLGAFRKDERGNIAVLTSMMLLPIVTVAGMGIDYSRSSSARSAYQQALDSATLAAAGMNLADNQRQTTGERVFRTILTSDQLANVKTLNFAVDTVNLTVTATMTAGQATSFMGIAGITEVSVGAKSQSIIAKPVVRQLDLTFCIDATGSMQPTLNAVQQNALSFESSLNAELTNRKVGSVDGMRVRVIYFRDFGGNTNYDPNSGGYIPVMNANGTLNSYSYRSFSQIQNDTNRYRYVGDLPPLKSSSFFPLPTNRTNFSSFVNAESAWGGGDLPESGLECVNAAMDSPWAKAGDVITGTNKLVEAVYPVVVVWTDADAHQPSHAKSLSNADYPAAPSTVNNVTTYAGRMPRSYADLQTKWSQSSIIDQRNKMLIFFGNSTTTGWNPVRSWPGFVQGGTLSEGNTYMVQRIADAVAAKVAAPVLSQ